MKTVIKSEAPECLQDAEVKGWDWNTFRSNNHDAYLSVRRQVLEDQRNECAYTGLWIGEGTTQKVHIDHFRKKAIYPEKTFCWDNLFAAAKDLDYGSDYKDKRIHGPKTNAESQYQTFWSPLHANLSNTFWYRQDGMMEPVPELEGNDREKALQTIKIYNLNAPDLKNRRKGIINMLKGWKGVSEEIIRESMKNVGFSFLIDFELRH